jgi:hypothetical protein
MVRNAYPRILRGYSKRAHPGPGFAEQPALLDPISSSVQWRQICWTLEVWCARFRD